jgi:prepilin-type N-terminal cleavage/methylation domain-containing protein
MKLSSKEKNKGFTLIEVIITIVMAAILAVMMFTYSNMSFIRGASSLTQTTKTFALQKVMENIFIEHRLNYSSPGLSAWQASHAYAAGNKVFPTDAKKNGRYYLCVTPGTSASTEPATWPTTIGGTVANGGVVWQEGLQTRIGTEGTTCNSGATTCVYGQYTVVYNRFIKFDPATNAEIPDNVDPKNNNILKVTIKNNLGETLSILLTLIVTQ